jgi:hypothetical protein
MDATPGPLTHILPTKLRSGRETAIDSLHRALPFPAFAWRVAISSIRSLVA